MDCKVARLDLFVAERAAVTRNAAQKLILSGRVLVNGALPAKAGYFLRSEDIVEIDLPKVASAAILPEEIPLDIIFEDEDLIVINKQKGLVVHPAAGHPGGTLVNALMFHCGESLSGINGEQRPGIVHRLDKDTTGLLVAAKNDAAHNFLASQFAHCSVRREYLAVVHGRFKDDHGTIDAPIARSKSDRKKMAVVPGGRRAVTNYRVLAGFEKYSLVRAALETGRTHQIRVHFAHIGRPVLGDVLYGGAKQPKWAESQVLHACLLGFVHPSSQKYVEFAAPPPRCFRLIFKPVKTGLKQD